MHREIKMSFLNLAVLGPLLAAATHWPTEVLALASGDGLDQDHPRFTCRASALRVDQLLGSVFEPAVANPPEDPCRSDSHVVMGAHSPGANVEVLVANTEDSAAPVTAEAFAVGANVLFSVVTAEVLEATARVDSVAGQCVLSSDSSVASAAVQGNTITVGDDPVDVPVPGVGVVRFNATLQSSNRVIQRALWLEVTDPLFRESSGVEEVIVGEAIADFEGGNPCGEDQLGDEPSDKGRMTGGGKFTDGHTTVTHGFVLHCDADRSPNNLQVNWDGNRFHLEDLTFAACSDDQTIDPGHPEADFDTYDGKGTGRYNGASGATAEWRFTDAGEPGGNDSARILIRDAEGTVVLDVPETTLFNGNHQAHGE